MKPGENLREFLARREGEVRDLIKLLKAEQLELKKVRMSLDGTDVAAREAPDGEPAGLLTIKDMIRAVIRPVVTGMVSSDIIATIENMFGPALERTSLSPQLSRLRRDGEVILEDGKWFPAPGLKHVVVEWGKPKEGSDASAPETSREMGAGDGSRGAPSQPTATDSIPVASTFANKRPTAFDDDLNDDVPF